MSRHIPPACASALWGTAVLVSCLLITGCSSLDGSHSASPPALTPADLIQVDAIAHYTQGLIFEDLDGTLTPRALEHYATAANLDAGHHRLYAKAATGYLLNQQPEKAIALLERSCRELPDSWLARVDLATAYQFVGDLKNAIRNFRLAARLEPDRVAVHVTIANLEFDVGRDDAAIDALEMALHLGGELNDIRALAYNRGLKFIESGEPRRALPCFHFVVQHTASQRGQVYYLIGQMFESLNLESQARQCYAWAVAEKPPVPQAYVKLALIAFDKSPAQALDILDTAHTALPDEMLIPLAKGQILSSQSRFTEAIPAYSLVADILKRQPALDVPSTFYLYYGAAYERCGDFARAEQVFMEGLNRHPDSHEVLNYLAYMWADRGQRLEDAFLYASQALKLDPHNGAYLDTLGWIYFRLGQYQNALKAIQSASNLVPDDPTITEHLGDTWSALGNRALALKYWKESYLLDSQNGAVAEKLQANGVDLNALLPDTATQARTPAP